MYSRPETCWDLQLFILFMFVRVCGARVNYVLYDCMPGEVRARCGSYGHIVFAWKTASLDMLYIYIFSLLVKHCVI